MTLLETKGLTRRYAGLVAVDHVDLLIPKGGIHAVIGPNGAGKTTLFNLISGLVVPSEGSIEFGGVDITGLPAFRRAALGMARTFQNIRIFGAMTVLENVLTGLQPRLTASLGAVIFRLPSFRAEERGAVAQARAALDLVGLAGRADEPASSLAYGDQRRLEIARAMAQSPRLLLLDEPAAGMNPAETLALSALVRRIASGPTTVLLVEHDMGFVMRLSDSVAVLNFGRRIFTGSPAAVRSEPAVVEAYLGARLAAKLQAQHG
jgi:branched-chain amino acid transport system ATP-binding protein